MITFFMLKSNLKFRKVNKMRSLILIFVLIALSLANCYFAQVENIVRIGYQKNSEIFDPYAPNMENYLQSGQNVESSSWSIYAQYAVFNRKRWSLLAGITFKKTNFIAEDRITNSIYYNNGNMVNYIYKDPIDYVSKSNSFGISAEFNYNLFANKIIRGQIGINSELYFLESFRATYVTTDTKYNPYQAIPIPEVGTIPKMFIYSASNISFFYRTSLNISPKISPAFKLSIGTNLHSDWNQFSRYAWLGLGLEVGFGQFKKDKNSGSDVPF